MLVRSEVIIFVAIGVLLAPSAGLAQEADLVSETFRETVQERTKSSGSVFRGIHYGPLDVRPDVSALSVVLPPGTERRLCLTIESQDGQYFGEASYLIPSRRSASARTVRLATKYRPIIESFALHDLSVVAHVADECMGSVNKVFVPMFLRRDRGLAGPVTMLVNSRSPGVLVQVFHDETKRRSPPCTADPGEVRQVAFNVACTLTLPAGTRMATLIVERSTGASVLPPETLRVYFP